MICFGLAFSALGIVMSTLAVVVLTPLLLAVALLVMVTSPMVSVCIYCYLPSFPGRLHSASRRNRER